MKSFIAVLCVLALASAYGESLALAMMQVTPVNEQVSLETENDARFVQLEHLSREIATTIPCKKRRSPLV